MIIEFKCAWVFEYNLRTMFVMDNDNHLFGCIVGKIRILNKLTMPSISYMKSIEISVAYFEKALKNE